MVIFLHVIRNGVRVVIYVWKKKIHVICVVENQMNEKKKKITSLFSFTCSENTCCPLRKNFSLISNLRETCKKSLFPTIAKPTLARYAQHVYELTVWIKEVPSFVHLYMPNLAYDI